ncbi:MAG: hypothetical protein IIX76_05200, partial [Bacteroidales bacterium]|nr:hypothetical protein [Bacteroidales bacterium]
CIYSYFKLLARPVTLSYSFIKGIYALDILKISHTYCYVCCLSFNLVNELSRFGTAKIDIIFDSPNYF